VIASVLQGCLYTFKVNEICEYLKLVDQASYYVPPCLKGAQETVFKEIDWWQNDVVEVPNVL